MIAAQAYPDLIPLLPDTIPHRLRERDQWVCWRLVPRGVGTWTKQPINARTGTLASTTNPTTWSTFDQVLAAVTNGTAGVDGIGYVFAADDPFVGIDLDHVDDHPELLGILDGCSTYQELSPSGTGVHLILEGTLPGGVSGRRKGPVEIYERGRFFTITGRVLAGVPTEPRRCDAALKSLWNELFPAANDSGPQATTQGTGSLSDGEILERASNARNGTKFRDLYFSGNVAAYCDDDSAADLALLSTLAFWSQDRAQLERLFSRSALGQRAKWQRADYRERTINRALDRTEHYTTSNGTTRAAQDDPDGLEDPKPHEPDPTPPPAPPFPESVFPAEIENYVAAGARSIGVPVEMIAVPLLVAAGSTIGNGAEVILKRGFKQLPTLWAGIVAPPGTAKSPSFQVAQWPLHQLQRDAYEHWQGEQDAYDAELEGWSAKPKPERGAKPAAPILQHLYSTDPTLEALVAMMNQCRGVAILRDELSGMIAAFDKYRNGSGGDLQEYLQLWSGAPIKADRKGGGSTYAVHPVAGICGGIQPDVLRGMHDPYGKRNGFIERFLLCVPDVEPSAWTDDELDPGLLSPVVDVFRKLRAIPKPDDAERVSVQLSTEARKTWVAWYDGNAAAIRQSTGLRRGFCSKLPNQVARIALVLHCLHNADDPRPMLTDGTMQAAIDVGEFFRDHLDRVLPLIGDTSRGETVGLAGRILRIVRTLGDINDDGWVSRSVIYNRLRNVQAPDLSNALSELEQHGTIEKRTVSTGTKPSEQWREKQHTRSYYSDYSDYPPSSEHNTRGAPNNQNSTKRSVEKTEVHDDPDHRDRQRPVLPGGGL